MLYMQFRTTTLYAYINNLILICTK